MPQEYLKNSDKPKLRKHKTRKTSKDGAPRYYALDKKYATKEEQSTYDTLIKKERIPDNDDIKIGVKRKKIDGSEKYVIVDPNEELARIKSRKYMDVLIYILSAVALIIAVINLVSFFFTTPTGQKLSRSLSGSSITENGDYIFGTFDDMVTIGDNIDTAIDILGFCEFPMEIGDTTYLHYGKSYLIIENNIVVGYYKSPDDDFKVTVGDKKKDIPRMIFIEDEANRVVDKLGSPDHYLKRRWIYYGIDVDYNRTTGDNAKNLTVLFDNEYHIASFELE